ncbi:hypothetical protein SGFS_079150 [Streptomyces graminofaciens]|uniref:Uncharacterized protein n=1 Tax=Streptomyces graminofaciens TaxID=68212 RepID=A0ABN5VTW7_9ACTN|nr:hypothetical protein SGFS_079150 [Streptomyces graminofaciens]
MAARRSVGLIAVVVAFTEILRFLPCGVVVPRSVGWGRGWCTGLPYLGWAALTCGMLPVASRRRRWVGVSAAYATDPNSAR